MEFFWVEFQLLEFWSGKHVLSTFVWIHVNFWFDLDAQIAETAELGEIAENDEITETA